MPGFQDLGLSPEVLQALEHMGYEEPSPVQTKAIPPLLAGRDLIVQALTGTGKTAAFAIPLVERVAVERRQPQGLVLAPTRELALQVAGEIARIGRIKQVEVLPIYGGQPYDRQFRSLRRGVHVIVATPGRLLDHLQRGTVDLSAASYVVLDEADEMLNMGFIEDVEAILQQLPAERQTSLYSATMPPAIVRLAERYLRQPQTISLTPRARATAPLVEHFYYQVPRAYKIEALCRLLDLKDPRLALVFCATKRMVDELAEELAGRGYRVEAIHGDINQPQRERVIAAAREGRIDVVVGTDVAARGLDIPEISHVINFDLPQDPDTYVHRIGRTGRAGRAGEALTLVAPWELRELQVIERVTGARLQRAEVPTVAELEARERELLAERVVSTLTAGGWGPYREVVEELAEQHDPVDLAAAALALLAGPSKPRVEIPPARAAKPYGDGRPAPPRHKTFAGPLRPERRAPYKPARRGGRT